MMLQCYARIVEKQRKAMFLLKRRMLARAVRSRYRITLLRAFLRWYYHRSAEEWVLVRGE